MEWSEYIKLLVGIISLANPIAAIPILFEITENETRKERRKIVTVASFSAFTILFVSLAIGDQILKIFGLTVESFRLGGGIIIIMTALRMMKFGEHGYKHAIKSDSEFYYDRSITVVPLTMPLMVGPGAITTMIIYGHKSVTVQDYFMVGLVILTITLFIFFSLYYARYIYNVLGRTGLNIMSRIMAIFLVAIGSDFIVSSIKEYFVK